MSERLVCTLWQTFVSQIFALSTSYELTFCLCDPKPLSSSPQFRIVYKPQLPDYWRTSEWGSNFACMYKICFSPVKLSYVNVIIRLAREPGRDMFSNPTSFSVIIVLLWSDYEQLILFLGISVSV